jgi:hypothetical protein
MPTSHRVFRPIVFTMLSVLVLGWLYLYLDSVRERRKAEHLIADLRSFPLATAGFPEVRQLTNQYGGTAVQSFPLPKFLPPGPPLRIPGHLDSEMPLPQNRTRPTCTPQDCTFDVGIASQTWIYDLRLDYRISELLASVLEHVGLRPWVVFTNFQIKNGKLWETQTIAVQARRETLGSHQGIGTVSYQVTSRSKANASESNRPGYAVFVPHRGTVGSNLSAYFTQTADTRSGRAFDVDLRCFTFLTRSCNGSSELAPSAWADYQATLNPTSEH